MKHLPTYQDAIKWSTEVNVKINTVDPTATPHTTTGVCPNIKILTTKTHIFDANLQNQLPSEYNIKSKTKQQEWDKYIAKKKSVIILIYGQCDNATLTELALGTTYEVDYYRLKVVCYESDDSSLSYKPYKVVVAVKLVHNFTNPRADDPHVFREEVKVKYNTTAIIGKFPNRTAFLKQLLVADTTPKNLG